MNKIIQELFKLEIKEYNYGLIEVITPFLDTSFDYISVYILDNVISDNGNTLQDIIADKVIKASNYISNETKYWNGDLTINWDDHITVINFTEERLMPFIQLLLKIQGIIENED